MEQFLERIGANAIYTATATQLIKYEVLISAMRALNYAYAGQVLSSKKRNMDFRVLNARSVRVMNRFAEIIALY